MRILNSVPFLLAIGITVPAPSPRAASAQPATEPPVAPASRGVEGPPLALADAVGEALAVHPDLAALRASAVAAARRPEVERYLSAPMVEAQVFQWPLDTVNPGDAQVMATVGQAFPGRGKRQLLVSRAEREAAVVAARVAVRAVQIAADVRRAFADLRLARRELAVYEENAALLRQLADVAEARYATGRVPQQDILKAIVERSRLEEDVVMAAEREGMAVARLNSLLHRAPEAGIGPLVAPGDDAAVPALADLLARAGDVHPELRMAAREVEAADADLAVTRAERRPDYVVRGGYMAMPGMTNAWTASVGITWPTAPWARRRVEAMTREAEARRGAAEAAQEAARNRLRLMVQEAWVRARAADARVQVLATSVLPQVEHALEIARIGYQADRLGFMEVIDTQRLLLESRLDAERAAADRERALAALEEAVGAPVTAPPALLPSPGEE